MEFNPVGYDRQVRAIIVFGDIRGFSVWEQSVTQPDIEFKPLINRFDAMVAQFEAKTGWFTKNLGDGYMQVIELPPGHGCQIALRVAQLTWEFTSRIRTMIERSPWPRPDGFRVRISSGHIWKKEGNKTDYIGRHVNMTHKLLRVRPERFFKCHQSFVELMSKRQAAAAGFRFTKADTDRRIPDGILKADMKALWRMARVRRKK